MLKDFEKLHFAKGQEEFDAFNTKYGNLLGVQNIQDHFISTNFSVFCKDRLIPHLNK